MLEIACEENPFGRQYLRFLPAALLKSTYTPSRSTFVSPPPIRVALSLLIATTFHAPTFSPTKTVLPLIMAEGLAGLKTMACNFGPAGLLSIGETELVP